MSLSEATRREKCVAAPAIASSGVAGGQTPPLRCLLNFYEAARHKPRLVVKFMLARVADRARR